MIRSQIICLDVLMLFAYTGTGVFQSQVLETRIEGLVESEQKLSNESGICTHIPLFEESLNSATLKSANLKRLTGEADCRRGI